MEGRQKLKKNALFCGMIMFGQLIGAIIGVIAIYLSNDKNFETKIIYPGIYLLCPV